MSNQIDSLDSLYRAACERRSVVCPTVHVWRCPRPAAFVLNLPGSVLRAMFQAGLYLYEKPKEAVEDEQ